MDIDDYEVIPDPPQPPPAQYLPMSMVRSDGRITESRRAELLRRREKPTLWQRFIRFFDVNPDAPRPDGNHD